MEANSEDQWKKTLKSDLWSHDPPFWKLEERAADVDIQHSMSKELVVCIIKFHPYGAKTSNALPMQKKAHRECEEPTSCITVPRNFYFPPLRQPH